MTLAERPAFGRVAALTILGSLVLLFFLGPFAAYCGLIADNRNALANRLALLERYQALAIRPASTAVSPETALLYPDMPESQTTALLQEAVKAAATAAHVEVQGLQVLRSDTASGATRIGVRVRAAGDITSLRDFLYAVESARPVLYPDNLSIQARAPGVGGNPSALDFQLDISGFKAEPSS